MSNKKWLYDLLKDGHFVDNRGYTATNGKLTDTHAAGKEEIVLEAKSARQHRRDFNNEPAIWQFLTSIASKTEELAKNPKSTLVLFNEKEYEHNTSDKLIDISGTDASNFTLRTGNLIGLVRHGKYSLKIGSRFGDAFLKYIIADADGFLELKDAGGEKKEEDYDWLLAFLWNIKFQRAYRLGLPKSYVTRSERIPRVRGTIDPLDYFQNKATGKYLCSYREHSYDNPALSLIIQAYEKLLRDKNKYPFCERTRSIYNACIIANQGVKRTRREVLQAKHFTNPFYQDYNVLIDLSKRVLLQQGADIDSENESSAFLFDVSMLFEYFIRKLLKRNGIHLRSKTEIVPPIPAGALSTYRRKLYPDLVFEHGDGVYVFDVKYKNFDRKHGVSREDLFQLHTYIGQHGNNAPVKGCGFVYPVLEAEWNQSPELISDEIKQHDRCIPFHVFFLKIPPSDSPNFNKRMQASCNEFVRTFADAVDRF